MKTTPDPKTKENAVTSGYLVEAKERPAAMPRRVHRMRMLTNPIGIARSSKKEEAPFTASGEGSEPAMTSKSPSVIRITPVRSKPAIE